MTVETTPTTPATGEVEQYQQAAPVVSIVPTTDVTKQLAAWVEAARSAHALATSLVQTSFVPATFRGKPAEATAAILAGMELGLSPMAALKAFDVIQGQAAPRAITLRAVVQAQGHDVWVEEESGQKAVVCGRRKGSTIVQKSEWTLEKARGLELLGKDNWKKQPAAMLVARATSEVCRRVASDAILGIPYSAEELWDSSEPQDAAPVVEARGLRARAQAARQARPATGPIPIRADVVEDVEPVDPEDPTMDPNWGQQ